MINITSLSHYDSNRNLLNVETHSAQISNQTNLLELFSCLLTLQKPRQVLNFRQIKLLTPPSENSPFQQPLLTVSVEIKVSDYAMSQILVPPNQIYLRRKLL